MAVGWDLGHGGKDPFWFLDPYCLSLSVSVFCCCLCLPSHFHPSFYCISFGPFTYFLFSEIVYGVEYMYELLVLGLVLGTRHFATRDMRWRWSPICLPTILEASVRSFIPPISLTLYRAKERQGQSPNNLISLLYRFEYLLFMIEGLRSNLITNYLLLKECPIKVGHNITPS